MKFINFYIESKTLLQTIATVSSKTGYSCWNEMVMVNVSKLLFGRSLLVTVGRIIFHDCDST